MLELNSDDCAFMLEPQTMNPPFAGEYTLGESADGIDGA